MSIATLVTACIWFLVVPSFTCANEANVNCLKSIYSQVEDPNGYLSSWVFGNYAQGYMCKFNGVICWHDDEDRVMSLMLSGYGLRGEFPYGIWNCSDLTGLELADNNFSGPLPSNIASLIPSLTILDLSGNSFSGEIPASLSNVTFLNTLMLQHNQFTGPLPPELALLERLSKFSVADNQLTGPIPNFNDATLKMKPDDFANNTDLCGMPLDACKPEEEGIIRPGKIGAAVGAALFAPLGAFLGWFFFSGRKEKQQHRSWIYHMEH